jgi:hypothetical protein
MLDPEATADSSDTDMDDDELMDDDPLINGRQADIEEAELDTVLDRADRQLDAVMAAQLRAALRDAERADEFPTLRPGRLGRDSVDAALAEELDAAQQGE